MSPSNKTTAFFILFAILHIGCGESVTHISGTTTPNPNQSLDPNAQNLRFKGLMELASNPMMGTNRLAFSSLYQGSSGFVLGGIKMNEDFSYGALLPTDISVQSSPICSQLNPYYGYLWTNPRMDLRESCEAMNIYMNSDPSIVVYFKGNYRSLIGKGIQICAGKPQDAIAGYKKGICALLHAEVASCEVKNVNGSSNYYLHTHRFICNPTAESGNKFSLLRASATRKTIFGSIDTNCDVVEAEDGIPNPLNRPYRTARLQANFESLINDQGPYCDPNQTRTF